MPQQMALLWFFLPPYAPAEIRHSLVALHPDPGPFEGCSTNGATTPRHVQALANKSSLWILLLIIISNDMRSLAFLLKAAEPFFRPIGHPTFLRWAIPFLCLPLCFSFLFINTIVGYNFANVSIRTVDLWCWKRLLFQRSHNAPLAIHFNTLDKHLVDTRKLE